MILHNSSANEVCFSRIKHFYMSSYLNFVIRSECFTETNALFNETSFYTVNEFHCDHFSYDEAYGECQKLFHGLSGLAPVLYLNQLTSENLDKQVNPTNLLKSFYGKSVCIYLVFFN